MKRVLTWLSCLAALSLAAFLVFAPSYADRAFNDPLAHEAYGVSVRALEVYSALPGVADLHADPLLWKRNLTKRHTRGHIDVPRLAGAKIAIQVFGAVTKTPRGQNYEVNSGDTDNITLLAMAQLWPIRTWWSLEARAIYQAHKLEAFAKASPAALVFVRTREDLDAVIAARASGQAITAGLMGLEGAHALEGDLAAVARLYDAGYRMLGLAHFFDNEVSGSAHGIENYGLTALGESVVDQAQSLGIIIDVAHASHAAIADVIARTQAPIVYSHGGVKGVCDNNRNLTDGEVVAIAATGGIIGLGAWQAAACAATPKALASAMDYVARLVGPEHVAIGSDFDGAVKTAFTLSDYDVLVMHLLEYGYTPQQIEAMMFGNVVRVLRQTLPSTQ